MIEMPEAVRVVANGRPLREVWRNELGGLTFQIGTGTGRRFVKWSPAGAPDLGREAARLRWAGRYIAVPRVLDAGADWLLTAGLPGESAVSERWTADPATAVTAIGRGLRRMHDTLPVDGCPYSWSVADRRAAAVLDPARWHEDHAGIDVASALARLADAPPVDVAVVCHSDACSPNTLIGDDGTCTGHVDLGELGVADRWADLAVATWSTTWNYGPGWENLLLDAYGVAADPERTAYYRLLWDVGP
jgi:kanamycin kinase